MCTSKSFACQMFILGWGDYYAPLMYGILVLIMTFLVILLDGLPLFTLNRGINTIDSVRLCGFWTLPTSLYSTDPDPSLVDLVKGLPDVSLLYVGFGSMETFMLDVDWEAFFVLLDSGMQIC